MAAYKEGSANVTNGSSVVTGNSTEWDTYVSTGYIFKLNSDSVFYEVAAVNSATKLTLSSRYVNASYQTDRTNEHIATSNVGTKVYSGYLNYTPIMQNSVSINASYETYTDDGAGTLTGTPTGSGNIDYDSGHWTINMAATHNASVDVTSSYSSGNALYSMSYSIVRDYTSHFEYPEMSTTDLNFQHLYTKAIRMIDSDLYNASVNAVTASSGFDVTATNQGLTLTSSNGTRYKITVSNTGTIVSTAV